MENMDFTIPVLGQPAIPSPVQLSRQTGDYMANYVDDNHCLIYDIEVDKSRHRDFSATHLLEKPVQGKKSTLTPQK